MSDVVCDSLTPQLPRYPPLSGFKGSSCYRPLQSRPVLEDLWLCK